MNAIPDNLMLLLTTSEVAVQLGLTGERVRQLMRAGELEGIQTPYGWLYHPAEVMSFKRKREDARRGRLSRAVEVADVEIRSA